MKKKTLLSIALGLLLGAAHAQEAWRGLFATDPMASNGCFILNPEKAASLRIATVEVKIVADKATSNAQVQHRTLQTFAITNGQFGFLDPQVLTGMEANETFHYEAAASDPYGLVVGEVSSICDQCYGWSEP